MISSIFPMLFAILLSSFGGGDLLDMLSTDGYWKAKGVTVTSEQLIADAKPPAPPGDISKPLNDLSSPEFKIRQAAREKIIAMGPAVIDQLRPAAESKEDELAETASALIKRFEEHAKERDVRRLMAIRTLGEHKEKSALPLLTESLQSKDLFVAEYAARAIAQIEGKPVPARPRSDLQRDLALLSPDLCAVMQSQGTADKLPTIETFAEEAAKMQDAIMAGELAEVGGGKDPNDPDHKKFVEEQKQRMIAQGYVEFLKIAERIGNARLDAVTLGVSKTMGEPTEIQWESKGAVTLIVSGAFDRTALASAIQHLGGATTKTTKDGENLIVEFEKNAAFIMPSNTQLAIAAGPMPAEVAAATAALKTALKSGKGGFDTSPLAPLAKAAKTASANGPLWAALLPNDPMKKASSIAPFDRVTLTTAVSAKDQILTYTVAAEGADADKIKAAAAEIEAGIKNTIAQMKPMAARIPMMQSYVDVLQSIKIETAGPQATLTGKAPANIMNLFIGAFGTAIRVQGPPNIAPAAGRAIENPQ